MQISKIKKDAWYQTKQGIGQCLAVGGTHPPKAKFNIVKPLPRGTVWLLPKEVEYELPKGDAPTLQSGQAETPGFTTGTLHKNDNGRWAIAYCCAQDQYQQVELTSGSVIELRIADHWIETSIEYNGEDYYATTPGIALAFGQAARVRRP